jgi:hypothetical protein
LRAEKNESEKFQRHHTAPVRKRRVREREYYIKKESSS